MCPFKLFLLNLLMDHLMHLITLEECADFRDMYFTFLVDVLRMRRNLLQ